MLPGITRVYSMENQTTFSGRRSKILIVDDNTDILEILKYSLIKGGFEVYTHTSGIDVMEAAEFYHPDLVLLDIDLPGRSGTEVCQELKNNYSIPVIYFSAHPNLMDANKICHADGFIEKPFDMNKLISDLRSYLR